MPKRDSKKERATQSPYSLRRRTVATEVATARQTTDEPMESAEEQQVVIPKEQEGKKANGGGEIDSGEEINGGVNGILEEVVVGICKFTRKHYDPDVYCTNDFIQFFITEPEALTDRNSVPEVKKDLRNNKNKQKFLEKYVDILKNGIQDPTIRRLATASSFESICINTDYVITGREIPADRDYQDEVTTNNKKWSDRLDQFPDALANAVAHFYGSDQQSIVITAARDMATSENIMDIPSERDARNIGMEVAKSGDFERVLNIAGSATIVATFQSLVQNKIALN